MHTSWKLCTIASAAALLGACAAVAPETASWTPSPVGSTWKVAQQNTGSYGKDAEVTMSRGDGTWQGQKVVTIAVSTGANVMMLPNGKWLAVLNAKDGKPLYTFDPPLGYEFPMKVGSTWKTHHKLTNVAAGRAVEFDYSCTVETYERVAVRAGAFDAFKIVCENELSRDVTWFSPGAGTNIKADYVRKAANPSGAGTQKAEMVSMSLPK